MKQKISFFRARYPFITLIPGLWALGFAFMGAYGMSDGFTTWHLPFWKYELGPGLFIAVFLLVWFSIPLSIFWMAMTSIQQVRIEADEVLFCLGPLVLRRLPFSEIKTVIRTGDDGPPPSYSIFTTRSNYRKPWRLVLSTIPAEELRLQSRSFREKRKMKNQTLRMADHATASNRTVRDYIAKRFSLNRLWLEWSPEAEEALREHLTTTIFIL
jgi:hypothetical protein